MKRFESFLKVKMPYRQVLSVVLSLGILAAAVPPALAAEDSSQKQALAAQSSAFTARVEAEDFFASTGNVYIKANGQAVPGSTSADDVVLTGASNGSFVDFSDPISDISSYKNTIPEGQDTASWKVTVPQAGNYKLSFKYNNPATKVKGHRNDRDERNCRVVINYKDGNYLNDNDSHWAGWMIFNISGYNAGYDSSANISLTPQTDNTYKNVKGNTAWNNNYMNVHLDKGENVITLGIQAPPGQAVFDGPNLDFFDVTYIGDEYVNKDKIPYINEDFVFEHPGIYYTLEDLENVKASKDDLNTVYGKGYQELKNNKYSASAYVDSPQSVINVGPYNNPNIGGTQFTRDGYAAHYNALRWYMDKDISNAKKSMQILNDWAKTLETVADGNDLKLRFALIGPEYINAAEILKNIYNKDPGVADADKWQEEDIKRFESFLRDKLLKKTIPYYPQANGNWDATIGAFNMSAAVYLEDVGLFNDALTQMYLGNIQSGNCTSMGSLPNYIYATGESQESSRDQTHARMGISGFAYQADIAWNQGINLYDAYNSRLLTGTLYNAAYITGKDVASETFISDKNRTTTDVASMVFEIVGNHYTNQAQKKGVDTDVIYSAAEQRLRAGTKNEGQTISYYGAMLYTDKPYTVSLNLKADKKTFNTIGDKIVIAADLQTDSGNKRVNWNIPQALKPYVDYKINADGTLEMKLIKEPENGFSSEIKATSVKNSTIYNTVTINYVSKASLEDVIRKTEDMKKTGAFNNVLTTVQTELNAALEEAYALMNREDATPEQVNSSVTRLQNVIGMADRKRGDKKQLAILLDSAKRVEANLEQYVEAGQSEFLIARKNSQTVMNDVDRLQEDVDKAYTELAASMRALRLKANKDALDTLAAKAGAYDLSLYTTDSASELTAALANASNVLADKTLSEEKQDVVDHSAARLQAAMDGLVSLAAGDGADNSGTGNGSPQTGSALPFVEIILIVFSLTILILMKQQETKHRLNSRNKG